MINYCNKEELRIYSDVEPHVCARTVLPSATEEEIKEIEKKPFLNKKNITFYIYNKDNFYVINVKRGYTWDGASIPFGFRWMLGGKGNSKFLLASMVHDRMCEEKSLVNYNRQLSSLIFKELLIGCKCSKFKANIMYLAVDNFQKFNREWK